MVLHFKEVWGHYGWEVRAVTVDSLTLAGAQGDRLQDADQEVNNSSWKKWWIELSKALWQSLMSASYAQYSKGSELPEILPSF